jgi:hypothetical protein
MIAEYLEHALQFERLAADETDPQQAIAYRKLAEKRAAALNLPPVNLPAVAVSKD